jgi:hypothetical protein
MNKSLKVWIKCLGKKIFTYTKNTEKLKELLFMLLGFLPKETERSNQYNNFADKMLK